MHITVNKNEKPENQTHKSSPKVLSHSQHATLPVCRVCSLYTIDYRMALPPSFSSSSKKKK